MKITAPTAAMRQLWSDRGTTGAVSLSIENGDAPVKNWKGENYLGEHPASTTIKHRAFADAIKSIPLELR